MGIGIHTGRVIVGNIGSLRRTKYAAVGAPVNMAGRIESFTSGGQVLISEDTRKSIAAPLRVDRQFQVEPKGVARSLSLYEIGGIGGPFQLALPSRVVPLRTLASPLSARFTILEEKFVGRTVHEGAVTAVSPLEILMESDPAPAILSNVKIDVAASPALGSPVGEIFGKVVAADEAQPRRVRIRFSSITPDLKAWLSG
jgi:adenylate cyclase